MQLAVPFFAVVSLLARFLSHLALVFLPSFLVSALSFSLDGEVRLARRRLLASSGVVEEEAGEEHPPRKRRNKT